MAWRARGAHLHRAIDAGGPADALARPSATSPLAVMTVARIVRVWLFALLQLVAIAAAYVVIGDRRPLADRIASITGRDRNREPGPFVVRAPATPGMRTRVVERRVDGQVVSADRAPSDRRRRWLLVFAAILVLANAIRVTRRALRARALDLAQPPVRELPTGAERVPDVPMEPAPERARLP